jgi:hypothetical protein
MEKRIGGRVERENDSEVSDAVPPKGSSPPLHFNCSPASLLVWWASTLPEQHGHLLYDGRH